MDLKAAHAHPVAWTKRVGVWARMRRWTLGSLIFLGVSSIAGRADDFGSWYILTVNHRLAPCWSTAVEGQTRLFDDSSAAEVYAARGKLAYDVGDHFSLGMNYVYASARRTPADPFLDEHRWETEVNNHWSLSDRLDIDLRHRLDLRFLEARAGVNERSRHRLGFSYRVRQAGPVESVFMSDEVFYDYDRHELTENRIVPAGIGFKLSERIGLNCYYMLRQFRLPVQAWQLNQYVVTQLSFAF